MKNRTFCRRWIGLMILALLFSLAREIRAVERMGPEMPAPENNMEQDPKGEEEQEVSGGIEADYNSRYVWRGIAFSDGAVLNPSLGVTSHNFTLSSWSNLVMADKINRGQINEIDLNLNYSYEQGPFTVNPAYQHYFYPNVEDAEDTGEISVLFSYALFKDWSLFTTQTVDVAAFPGAYYAEVGMAYEPQINDRIALASNLRLGFGSDQFNKAYLGETFSGLEMVAGDLELTYYPVKAVYLRPHLGYSSLLSERPRDAVKQPDLFSFGLAVGKEF